LPYSLHSISRPNGRFYGSENATVTRASTNVSGNSFLHFKFRRLGILFQQMVYCDNQAWRAEATLHSTLINEALLYVGER
jgi:hypothetical protein